jgi:CO/xanthine dehydrogenase Mo-binding subunit/aerobic-type carbon monoxide dehydrogenase small subunit (CoxS/CutS family)
MTAGAGSGTPKMDVTLTVNGRPHTLAIEPCELLVDTLRGRLGLTGTKRSCDVQVCGACTVLVNGAPVSACTYLTYEARDKEVLTIEGLAPGEALHPMQQAFVDHAALQCGFCTPGMILAAAALVREHPRPSIEDIKRYMHGNICRCTGYKKIVEAIQAAAATMHGSTDGPATRPRAGAFAPECNAMTGREPDTAFTVVGRPAPRVDAVDKVTGRAVYASDVGVPGMLEARVLRSPVAHARIVRIDTARAEALPGVAAVLTAADVRDIDPYYGIAFKDQPLVAIERVRYQGEPVAAVAAVDARTAEAALELITVEYDELPVVATIDDALAAGSPRLHGELRASGTFRHPKSLRPLSGTNICQAYSLRRGDAAAGFAEADVVVENVYTLPPVQHVSLESFVAIASWTRAGLEVWASAQHPFHVRRELAQMFGLPHHAVRVHSPMIGGAFGQKSYTKLEPLAAALARKAGRPVRVALSIPEAFLTLTRHGARLRVKTGARRDGTLVARKVELWLDTGAYADVGPRVTQKAGYWSIGLYRWPHLEIDAFCVFTNKVPAGAFRGYGGPQAGWAGELQITELAAALGLDPVELRRRNLLGRGERYDPPDTPVDGDIKAHLDRIERVLTARGAVRAGRGRGIVVGFKNGGGMNTVSNSIVRLHADGSATVGAGSVEIGQGARTALAQIAAEALALPLPRVRVPEPDTELTPFDHGTSASRSTTLMGYAVWQAALDVRRQLTAIAAEAFEAPLDMVRLADGVASAGPRCMTYTELIARHSGTPNAELIGTGVYRLGTFPRPPGGTATFWEMGVGGAEVDVDTETGEIRVSRYISTADVGRAINPPLCEGQDEGAAMQGIGHALREELVFDQGQLLNAGLIEYTVPTMEMLPDEFASILFEDGGGPGPYGAKGVGEGSIVAPAPAIAAALHDATGVWVRDLPMTPERVWRALRDARACLRRE